MLSIPASADTYVSAASPTKNFGRGKLLTVDGRPEVRTLLRFEVSGVTGTVTGTTLSVRARQTSTTGFEVRTAAAGWNEATVTWNGGVAVGDVVATSGPTVSGQWVNIALPGLVGGNGTLALALTTPAATAVSIDSRETSMPPRLVVAVQPPTVEPPPPVEPPPVVEPPPTRPRMFAYYYLWWSTRHWEDKLGASYPYGTVPAPLPATVDASGCNPVSLYSGNQLIDVHARLISQDEPGAIEADVRAAAAAGLTGFIANWRGVGTVDQTSDSVSYSRRLAELVRSVNEVNAEGIPFKLWISYKASDTLLDAVAIDNDLAYLAQTYGANTAFDRTYGRPVVVWMGSRKYTDAVVTSVSAKARTNFYLVGDENWTTWTPARAAAFDGDQYYWSSQNPVTNPNSFTQLANLATSVRSSGLNPDGSVKRWFAPITPGYNSILLGGSTCVPRNDGATMRSLYAGNKATNPDAWVVISWNEIAEGTHLVPLQRWGTRYLDELSAVMAGG